MDDDTSEDGFRKQNWRWWNPPKNSILTQFCNETSLDGLKYVGQQNRHIVERLFWLIAFVCGLTMAGILIDNIWQKYNSNPVIVAFAPEAVPIARLPFPAITVCNENIVRKSAVLEIERNTESSDPELSLQAKSELQAISTICESKLSLAQMMNPRPKKMKIDRTKEINILNLLYKVSHPCDEMVQQCFLGSSKINCNQEFRTTLTKTGLCCTINMLPSQLLLHYPEMYEPEHKQINADYLNVSKVNEDLWKMWRFKDGYVGPETRNYSGRPFKQFKPGKPYGLSLLLFPDIDNYYCTSGDSLGFKVIVHSPLEFPHPRFGHAVPPGTEVFTSIIPELSVADDRIFDVSISSRRCYFPDEFPLKFFKAYTDLNCNDECVSNYTYKACGCVWYFLPHDEGRRLCQNSDRSCTRALSANTSRGVLHCNKCYPLCDELDFRLESSFSYLKDYTMLWPDGGNDMIKNSSWYGKPITILNMFYGQRSVVPKIRKKLFETSELIASVGGLLGLCLGFSMLSAIELVYFCTMRHWFIKRRTNTAVKQVVKKFVNKVKQLTRKKNLREDLDNPPIFQVNPGTKSLTNSKFQGYVFNQY